MSQANWALGVLLGINLLNYLDRQVLYSLLPLIKAELSATDAQLGALACAFMIVYMVAAPPIGYWADRSERKNWIGSGVLLWSVATILSAASRTYGQLFGARALVGIGESCYGSVSPSFVAEHFPPAKRASALALFSMAIPVGSALGYILGGWIGQHFGWRAAFTWAGIPGIALAVLAFRLRDPRTAAAMQPQSPALEGYLGMFRNRSFTICSLAMAAQTFGLGAFAVWMPSFFTRNWGMSVAQAGTSFGAITVLAGVAGSLIGGWLADKTLKATPNAYFLVSGLGLLAAVPLSVLTLAAPSFRAAAALLFAAEFCAFLNMGPLNAVIVSVIEQPMRSMAFAANIFVIHLLGDAFSPAVVGFISDARGLRAALVFASAFLGVAGAICMLGMRYFEADQLHSEVSYA